MKLLFGTGNQAKLKVMKIRLKPLGINLIGLEDLKKEGYTVPSVPETGNTPLENARQKAMAYYQVFEAMVTGTLAFKVSLLAQYVSPLIPNCYVFCTLAIFVNTHHKQKGHKFLTNLTNSEHLAFLYSDHTKKSTANKTDAEKRYDYEKKEFFMENNSGIAFSNDDIIYGSCSVGCRH